MRDRFDRIHGFRFAPPVAKRPRGWWAVPTLRKTVPGPTMSLPTLVVWSPRPVVLESVRRMVPDWCGWSDIH